MKDLPFQIWHILPARTHIILSVRIFYQLPIPIVTTNRKDGLGGLVNRPVQILGAYATTHTFYALFMPNI